MEPTKIAEIIDGSESSSTTSFDELDLQQENFSNATSNDERDDEFEVVASDSNSDFEVVTHVTDSDAKSDSYATATESDFETLLDNDELPTQIQVIKDNVHQNINTTIVEETTTANPEPRSEINNLPENNQIKYKHHYIRHIDDGRIEITAKSGAVVTVSADNYYGYRMENGFKKCVLCCMLLGKNEQSHTQKKHGKVLHATIDNVHCVRKVNNEMYNCILCCETMPRSYVIKHICCDSHHDAALAAATKKAVDDYIFSDIYNDISPYVSRRSGKNLVSCPDCNLSMHPNNLARHVDNKHLRTKMITTANLYYCYICKVNLPNVELNIKEHEQGAYHLKLLTASVGFKHVDKLPYHKIPVTDKNIHHLMKLDRVGLKCTVCDVYIFPRNVPTMMEHIRTMYHEQDYVLNEKMKMMSLGVGFYHH